MTFYHRKLNIMKPGRLLCLLTCVIFLLSLGTSLSYAQDTELRCTDEAPAGDAMEISVTNELGEEITLFWIDPNCDEIFYHTIAPGATVTQGTFVNHEWVIRTSDGTAVEQYTASPDRTVIIISATAPASNDLVCPDYPDTNFAGADPVVLEAGDQVTVISEGGIASVSFSLTELANTQDTANFNCEPGTQSFTTDQDGMYLIGYNGSGNADNFSYEVSRTMAGTETSTAGSSFPFAATMVSENPPDLLAAPGGASVTRMNPIEAITVTGISEDGEWFSITDSVGNEGWVPVSGVVLPENVTFSSPGAAVSAHEAHWGYEGVTGPEHWGELAEAYEACAAGRAQSPVDIGESTEVSLVDIQFNYSESAVNIFNNGHTIRVNVDPGSSITYNEIRYDLLQFHFHHPSEHVVDGQPMAMEIHFVHQSESGNYAVVGALIVAGEEPNTVFASVFDHLPAHESEPASVGAIRLIDLLPAGAGNLTYVGSLTTPPCSEEVRWLLVDEFVVLTQAQIDAFAAIFPLNARPVQPLNNRDLLWDNQ